MQLTARLNFSLAITILAIQTVFAQGDIHTRKVDSSRVRFANTVDFNDHTFRKELDMSQASFDSCARFSKVTFDSKINFFGTSFDSLADFTYCTFNSTAYFHKSNFNSYYSFSFAKFDSLAHFNGAELFRGNFVATAFNSGVEFEDATFDSVYFNLANLRRVADFSGARFNSAVHFVGTRFDSLADFRGANFDSFANFRGKAVFNSDADFRNASFNRVDFEKAEYNSVVQFSNATFNSEVYFNNAAFDSISNFNEVNFKSLADFSGVKFHEKVSFDRCRFHTLANFKGTLFNTEPSFYNSILPDTLIFFRTRLKKGITINLNNIRMKENKTKCAIDLREFPIDKLRLRWDNFELFYPKDSTINYQETRGIYNDLLLRFKHLGYTTSYELCDKEFREFEYLNDPSYKVGFGSALNLLDKLWWGYSYDLWRIALNSFIILIIFTTINYYKFERLNQEVYKITNIYESYQKNFKHKYLFVFQYSSYIFFGLSMKLDRLSFEKKRLTIWLQFQFITGLVCMAFIVNYFFG